MMMIHRLLAMFFHKAPGQKIPIMYYVIVELRSRNYIIETFCKAVQAKNE